MLKRPIVSQCLPIQSSEPQSMKLEKCGKQLVRSARQLTHSGKSNG